MWGCLYYLIDKNIDIVFRKDNTAAIQDLLFFFFLSAKFAIPP